MARLGNGRVVPSGDAAALAAAMIEVTRMDPAERERLGANGREAVVQGFAMDQVTDQWCALYHARLPRGRESAQVAPPTRSVPAGLTPPVNHPVQGEVGLEAVAGQR
jgi:hypothetical protein